MTFRKGRYLKFIVGGWRYLKKQLRTQNYNQDIVCHPSTLIVVLPLLPVFIGSQHHTMISAQGNLFIFRLSTIPVQYQPKHGTSSAQPKREKSRRSRRRTTQVARGVHRIRNR